MNSNKVNNSSRKQLLHPMLTTHDCKGSNEIIPLTWNC